MSTSRRAVEYARVLLRAQLRSIEPAEEIAGGAWHEAANLSNPDAIVAARSHGLEGLVAVDPLEFRGIIGHFATGVTVITTAAGEQLHGMTANAVSSLSLDPVMVLICVDKTAHAHRVLDEGGVFTVNILSEEQEAVSRVFAKKGEPETGALRGQAFHLGETGAPILEGCLAYIECRVANVLDGGDHSIFLGQVVNEGVEEELRPLLFYRGGYHTLGV